MKDKKLDTLLFSTIGVCVMFVIVVAINLIASAMNTRVDLTENKVYTLSPGTKAILAKIDAPVEIRFTTPKASRARPRNSRPTPSASRICWPNSGSIRTATWKSRSSTRSRTPRPRIWRTWTASRAR